jgi:hypothetical protein
MQISLFAPVLISIVFGLVVAAIELLIAGAGGPWPVRSWLARAWVYACFCYIILFGIIKV